MHIRVCFLSRQGNCSHSALAFVNYVAEKECVLVVTTCQLQRKRMILFCNRNLLESMIKNINCTPKIQTINPFDNSTNAGRLRLLSSPPMRARRTAGDRQRFSASFLCGTNVLL